MNTIGRLLMLTLLVTVCNTAFGQYVNQTGNVYSDKEGNLFVKVSYTSTNMSRSDRSIYLNTRNANSKSKEILTWTNGGYKEVNDFITQLINGLSRGPNASFQINYRYRASVIDSNNLKVYHTTGGFSYFNRTRMLLLLQAIKIRIS